MSSAAGDALRVAPKSPSRGVVISVLGVTQIFAWGSSYYLPAVLAKPIASDTGWSLSWVVGGLSLGLLIAGLVSPWVGRAIARRGGRPVLAVSAGLLAAGLIRPGAGAFSACFSDRLVADWTRHGRGSLRSGLCHSRTPVRARGTLGNHDAHAVWRLREHRLLASFRIPRCPSWMARRVSGLRRLPARGCVPGLSVRSAARISAGSASVSVAEFAIARASTSHSPRGSIFLLLAATITLSSVISTTLSVHLLTVLQAKGLTLAAAVGLGALVGPSQVAARAVEMVIARYHHPIWTKVASTSLVATGLAALWLEAPIIPLALALYGAGIGLESIARGTLPLAVFGPERYPVIMGRIAMPSLIAQAAAPSIGAALIETGGVHGAMGVFVAAAVCNVLLAASLFLFLRKRAAPI